ncbi:HAD family hydrolase [Catenovulum sp. SM1970]|uniref:Cof-type HAD-IIB family hydrolase n=1 Tax=Marinifaba aquimaris TaxID=2741323 RepID=UPI0015724D6C|nr:Cof-type HAD-IIB family hydrolase [Marinifaba aquimaris]NTS76112.1 HAD family hydrolase [Marinifaba aquimaris]
MTSIKFIAVDMDGTLLDDNKCLPTDFFAVFEQLSKKNIVFAAASGRQYQSLAKQFAGIKNKMLFIAENGTLVVYQDKVLFSQSISPIVVSQIIEKTRQIKSAFIVVCGKKSAYVETKNQQALAEIRKYYHQLEIVDDLKQVNDEFIKVAILDFNGTEKHVYPHLAPHFETTHQVVISAYIWLDIMHPSASKGQAICQLREIFDFTYEQSMSFGDYLNDKEMLTATYHSYAMANAHPDIKKVARHIAPSNQENGVIKTIRSQVLNEEPG